MRWNRLAGNRAALLILSWLGAWFLRALGSTWRISFESSASAGPNPGLGSGLGPRAEPRLAAFWHRNIFMAAFVFRDRLYSVPASRSREGDLITAVLARLGFASPPRGSSSRGGAVALRALVRRLKAGSAVAIPTDGPRGPARVCKPGIVGLARLSGIPISPVGIAASPRLCFRSWDRGELPLPFARVVCAIAPSISISRDVEPGERQDAMDDLDAALNHLTDALDRRLGNEAQSARCE